MGRTVTIDTLPSEIEKLKLSKKKIVLVGGCFDILHRGHVEFLERSKKLGDSLIILLESDERIRQLKGADKPKNRQSDRAYLLSALSSVDFIVQLPVLKTDSEYLALVKIIKPDIIAITKKDPITHKKAAQAKTIGSSLVEVMERKEGYSSSTIEK